MDSLVSNNKICRTCSEISPAELNNCQYCGSLLEDISDDFSSDLDLKITIGKLAEEKKTDEPEDSKILTYEKTDSYVEEAVDKRYNGISADQAQFNDVFGFKSSSTLNENIVKNDSISNGRKVLLTLICAIIPGFGQLFCLILSIAFMNSEGNEDKKSFGNALFVAALVMFVLTCIISLLIALLVYQPPQM